MPTNILMPALSPTMTEGKLASWRKKEGDKVKAGDVIAEIETDKATMEMEAADDGVLGKILVADQLPANDPVRAFDLRLISDYRVSTGGQPISTFSGHAYDALSWALAALRTLPDGLPLPAARQAVRDALETKIVNFVGTHGIFTLSPEDHLGFKPDDFAVVTVKGGKFVILPRNQWK